ILAAEAFHRIERIPNAHQLRRADGARAKALGPRVIGARRGAEAAVGAVGVRRAGLRAVAVCRPALQQWIGRDFLAALERPPALQGSARRAVRLPPTAADPPPPPLGPARGAPKPPDPDRPPRPLVYAPPRLVHRRRAREARGEEPHQRGAMLDTSKQALQGY